MIHAIFSSKRLWLKRSNIKKQNIGVSKKTDHSTMDTVSMHLLILVREMLLPKNNSLNDIYKFLQ